MNALSAASKAVSKSVSIAVAIRRALASAPTWAAWVTLQSLLPLLVVPPGPAEAAVLRSPLTVPAVSLVDLRPHDRSLLLSVKSTSSFQSLAAVLFAYTNEAGFE